MFLVNGHRLDGEAGLVQLLDLAQREVSRSFAEALGDDPSPPLRGSRYRVLTMLPAEGGRRLTDLATIADMTKQAMGEFVADLAEQGYVVVTPDPDDRRAKQVRLTDAGRQAAEVGRDLLGRVQALWDGRLGPEDAATLTELLARVAGVERRPG